MNLNSTAFDYWVFENLEPDLIIHGNGKRYKEESPYMQDYKKREMIAHIGQAIWEQKTKEEQDRSWHIWESTHRK